MSGVIDTVPPIFRIARSSRPPPCCCCSTENGVFTSAQYFHFDERSSASYSPSSITTPDALSYRMSLLGTGPSLGSRVVGLMRTCAALRKSIGSPRGIGVWHTASQHLPDDQPQSVHLAAIVIDEVRLRAVAATGVDEAEASHSDARRHAEVTELCGPIFVDKHVGRLAVMVANSGLVQKGHACVGEHVREEGQGDVELDCAVGHDLEAFRGITQKTPQAALGHKLHQHAEALAWLVNCESQDRKVRRTLLKHAAHKRAVGAVAPYRRHQTCGRRWDG
eukprot:scaffold57656_cov63-Phaeocystis_antarctica.AAC.2